MDYQAKVTYLLNSGFIVELGKIALIFDYYQDPLACVEEALKDKDQVYFFVSHVHFDHYNPAIGKFANQVTKYFISYDVSKGLPATDNVVKMNEYMDYKDDCIKVKSFSSTDEGISFYVEIDGWKLFHAGDFNWWHWKGDTPTNIAFARNGFVKQLKRLAGLSVDIAFFPVDSRLEEFCDLGVTEFCKVTTVKNLVTMHNVGGKTWIMPEDFPKRELLESVWSPRHPGEYHLIKYTEDHII